MLVKTGFRVNLMFMSMFVFTSCTSVYVYADAFTYVADDQNLDPISKQNAPESILGKFGFIKVN